MNEQNQQFPVRFTNMGRALLFIFAGAVPLWFLPWRINVDFGREMTFLLLILGAFVLWLLSGLLTGRFRFVRSSGLYAGAFFVLVALASTLLSKMPFVSAFLSDPSAERWSTLLAGFVLMVVTANLLVSVKEVSRALLIFLLAAGLEACLTFVALAFNFSVFHVIAPFIQNFDFNVIGTINGAVLLYTVGLVMGLGFSLSGEFHQLRTWVRWAVYAAIFFFAANLFMVHFRTAWIILFISSLFLSGFMFWMSQRSRQDEETEAGLPAVALAKAGLAQHLGRGAGLGWKYALSLIVLAVSLVMLMVPGPLVGKTALPTEVSPSAMTTLRIARSVYREGAVRTLFGSGPATFSRDWMRYKDAAINNTPFWGTQFNQGYSLITTLAATAGIVGVASFLLFILGFLIVSLRALLSMRQEHAGFMSAVFLGFVGMVCIAALYPANLTFVLLLFFFAGLLMAGLVSRGASESDVSQGRGYRAWLWSISERWAAFRQPWAIFAFSLAIVLLLSLSIGMLYYEITRVRSAFAQISGLAAVDKGDIDGAIRAFERAAGYENGNARLYQALVQLRTEKVRSLIASAAQGKNVQNDFQQTLQAAIQNSQSGLALAPEDPVLWQTQGALYELIIPYIPGADRLAFGSYQKEMELDPFNPTGRIDLARAGLAAADRIQLALNQQQSSQAPAAGAQQGVDTAELTSARSQILDQVEKVLQEAVGMKADFAAAHFLLAQTSLRAGNMQKAIQSTENTKLAAPFDIGVAFQLGLLYYQNNNLEQSAKEFERAVSLNQQYSNARYFLGLIRSRQGNVAAAIAQFEEIAKLNPDNQEIKQILENLRAGRPALDNIAPPATPPEQRNQPPVAEDQKSSVNAPVPKRGGKK